MRHGAEALAEEVSVRAAQLLQLRPATLNELPATTLENADKLPATMLVNADELPATTLEATRGGYWHRRLVAICADDRCGGLPLDRLRGALIACDCLPYQVRRPPTRPARGTSPREGRGQTGRSTRG